MPRWPGRSGDESDGAYSEWLRNPRQAKPHPPGGGRNQSVVRGILERDGGGSTADIARRFHDEQWADGNPEPYDERAQKKAEKAVRASLRRMVAAGEVEQRRGAQRHGGIMYWWRTAPDRLQTHKSARGREIPADPVRHEPSGGLGAPDTWGAARGREQLRGRKLTDAEKRARDPMNPENMSEKDRLQQRRARRRSQNEDRRRSDDWYERQRQGSGNPENLTGGKGGGGRGRGGASGLAEPARAPDPTPPAQEQGGSGVSKPASAPAPPPDDDNGGDKGGGIFKPQW